MYSKYRNLLIAAKNALPWAKHSADNQVFLKVIGNQSLEGFHKLATPQAIVNLIEDYNLQVQALAHTSDVAKQALEDLKAKNTNYRLFIDDERYPKSPHWLIARTSYDAIRFTREFGLPTEIAFDHDLGGRDTAIIYINWLEDFLLDNEIEFPLGFTYSIHSQNPIGAANMKSKMDQLIEHVNGLESSHTFNNKKEISK